MMRHSISQYVAPKSPWLAALVAMFLSTMALGAVPKILHYQGYLTDATGQAVDCPDGLACNGMQYDMTFRLYDSAQGGSSLWEEKVTAVPIRQGIFDVLLGADNPIDAGTLDLDAVYLGLTINDTDELAPRQQFASAAYAIRAEYAQDSTSLGGKAATEYVASEDIAGLCITDEELATQLAEKSYCTECYSDTSVGVYLTDNGYQPGPGYTDGQVQTYLDDQGYVSGPHTTDTDTQLTAAQVLQMVANGGYATGPHTTDTQLSPAQVLQMVANGGYANGPHTTDTQLSPGQVLQMVSDGGYVTGSHTTDTQLTAAQVLQIVAVNGGYATGPHTTDTDTHLSSPEVLSMVSTGGYVTGGHTVDTTRSDAEIQAVVGPHTTDTDTQLSSETVLSMVGGGGYVTGEHTVDTTRSDAEIQAVVGPHTTDTDTHLSSAEVLSMVNGGGYVTGGHTVDTTRSDAEIQAVVGPHTTDTQLSADEVLKIVGDAGFLMASDIPPAIPSGMIGFFPGDCPVGWTDLSTSFGGRALVLAPEDGNVGENGIVGTPLTNLETPTITDVVAHTHSGPSHTHTGPSHTHDLNVTGSTTYNGDHGHATACHGKCNNCPGNGHQGGGGSQPKNTTCTTSTNGNHKHSVTLNGSLGSGGTEETGNGGTGSTGTTGSAAVDVNLPYIQLKACQAP